jgi:protein-S-isoprenylcysteine O-methyltransferase Ste14
MVVLELWRVPTAGSGYGLRQVFPHAAITWLGTLVGLGVVGIAWSTLTIYRDSYYASFFATVPLILIGTLFVSPFFIFAAETTFGPSARGGYQLGLLLLGRVREINWYYVRDNIIVWLIRGFFLPLNFCELVRTIQIFRGNGLSMFHGPWMANEYYFLLTIYGLILAAVMPGYIFGSRLLRTETSDVSHSWRGWIVTLVCYAPLETAVFKGWFNYNPSNPSPAWSQPWVTHLQYLPTILQTVGGAIILFSLVHLWGEAQFGLRSSNLSNRGIITTGAYRFCKHPVYAAKCAVWFLIWLPFLSGTNALDGLRLTILWACICAIYFLRALEEEKLLSSDPAYVAYALWMEKHGMFRDLGAIFPPLKFSWRLNHWQEAQ